MFLGDDIRHWSGMGRANARTDQFPLPVVSTYTRGSFDQLHLSLGWLFGLVAGARLSRRPWTPLNANAAYTCLDNVISVDKIRGGVSSLDSLTLDEHT